MAVFLSMGTMCESLTLIGFEIMLVLLVKVCCRRSWDGVARTSIEIGEYCAQNRPYFLEPFWRTSCMGAMGHLWKMSSDVPALPMHTISSSSSQMVTTPYWDKKVSPSLEVCVHGFYHQHSLDHSSGWHHLTLVYYRPKAENCYCSNSTEGPGDSYPWRRYGRHLFICDLS